MAPYVPQLDEANVDVDDDIDFQMPLVRTPRQVQDKYIARKRQTFGTDALQVGLHKDTCDATAQLKQYLSKQAAKIASMK